MFTKISQQHLFAELFCSKHARDRQASPPANTTCSAHGQAVLGSQKVNGSFDVLA